MNADMNRHRRGPVPKVYVEGTFGTERGRIQAALDEQGVTVLQDHQEALTHATHIVRLSLSDGIVSISVGHAARQWQTTEETWRVEERMSPEEHARAVRENRPDLTLQLHSRNETVDLEFTDEPTHIELPALTKVDGRLGVDEQALARAVADAVR